MKTLALATTILAGWAQAAPDPNVPYPPQPVRLAPPDMSYAYADPHPSLTLPWALAQLLPSPEIAFGQQRRIALDGTSEQDTRTAFGLRWQLTPVLWSFGVHRNVSRWRFFVVDPLARHSGSLELSQTFEYIGGHVDRVVPRAGLRVYLPLAHRGEYLSMSLGTSAYAFDGARVAYDAGIYILSGFLGLQFTAAPSHRPLQGIATIRIKYF